MANTDPLRNFKFKVSILGNGVPAIKMGFTRVSGLERTIEVIEYREGGDNITTKKFTGQASFGDVTLERGMTTDQEGLNNWMNQVYNPVDGHVEGQDHVFKKTVHIFVASKDGNSGREIVLLNAFPTSRTLADLDAGGNEIFIETLVLTHSGQYEKALVGGVFAEA